MSSTREMTDEEREILQSIIDEMYDESVRVIAEGRSMDEADVRRIGDGRIYTGLQAKEINLVDQIGNLDDAIDQMMEDHGLKDATVVEYNYTPGFFSSFGLQVKGLFDDMSELKMIQQLLSGKRSTARILHVLERRWRHDSRANDRRRCGHPS